MSFIEKKTQAPSCSSPIPRANYTHPTTKTLSVKIIQDITARRAIAFGRVPCSIAISNRDILEPYLRSSIHTLRSTIFDLQSSIYNLRSTIFDLQSSIYNLRSTIFDLQSSIYNLRSTIYSSPAPRDKKIQFVCSYQHLKLLLISFFTARNWTIEWNDRLDTLLSDWQDSAQGFARLDGYTVLMESMLRLWSNWQWPGGKSVSNGRLETLVGSFWPLRFNCNWHPASSSTMTTIDI